MSTSELLKPSLLGRRLSVAEMETNMDIMGRPSSGLLCVKDSPYSAKGDGVADDTDPIASAIDAAAKIYSQTGIPQGVFIPAGVFSVRTVVLKSGVTLMGSGWSTVLLSRTNTRVITLAPEGVTQTPCKEAAIRDLCIMGGLETNPGWANGPGEGTSQGIGLQGSADPENTVLIQNIAIVGTRREGIYLERMNARIKDVYLHKCGLGTEALGGGITLKDCYDTVIEGVDASNIRGNHGVRIENPLATWSCCNLKVTKPYKHGFHVLGGSAAGFCHMMTVENCPERPVFLDEGTQNVVMNSIRCGISTGGFPAMSLYKAKNVLLEGIFAHGTPDGVKIEGGAEYGNVRILGLFSPGNRLVVPDGCTNIKDLDA